MKLIIITSSIIAILLCSSCSQRQQTINIEVAKCDNSRVAFNVTGTTKVRCGFIVLDDDKPTSGSVNGNGIDLPKRSSEQFTLIWCKADKAAIVLIKTWYSKELFGVAEDLSSIDTFHKDKSPMRDYVRKVLTEEGVKKMNTLTILCCGIIIGVVLMSWIALIAGKLASDHEFEAHFKRISK